MKQSQITVAEMAPHVHGFATNENKTGKITLWFAEWIKNSLKAGKIKPYDLLPPKSDMACHIGVSKGTMQNVFRTLEDEGLVESKQKIGTYIKDKGQNTEKLTSKRETAIEKIKKYLTENNYKKGDCLISIRKLSNITGISNTTVRAAVCSLVSDKVLKNFNNTFIIDNIDFGYQDIETKTLAEKISEKLKILAETIPPGGKLPAGAELAKKFGVSVKTVHDAVKLLSKEGMLQSGRGRYGTIVTDGDTHIFYNYEKIEIKIRSYITENCSIGAKLPPIISLSQKFGVSTKTVKKALDNLAEQGCLTFRRGRYGGTFVTRLPQEAGLSYKWLSLNPDYIVNT